ncbi:NAD(P)-binding domain-containing protein [Streptomyces sp. ET3-23]|uniref:NAD(P)-dependent oxidoreductase n=1 Tax=Streptomyces sp. ET3-23 TaxID=2885643 RepID=UPI001D10BB2B|nr:NAD(P)-binding domain-containing protein [Streptomyces sp. ET3-23]MCC2275394.1 NAD(P)-binding domain-containing protein [Streptomyces sp. ET3-23]
MSVLGLGPMGTASAAAFLRAGHRTAVWHRTPGAAGVLVVKGAVEAGSVGAAVAAGPLVVVCAAPYEAARAVLDTAGDGLAGRTLVVLAPGSPVHARETADWAERHGVGGYLDGVVMSSPPGVGGPGCLLLCSGDQAAFDEHRKTLAALGEPFYLGPDAALASVYETALLGLMSATLTGWLHSVALVGAAGPGGNVPATEFTEVARRWLHSVGELMGAYAPQIGSEHCPADGLPLERHLAMADILVHASELRGVPSGLPELLREPLARAVAAGHGGEGYARLAGFVACAGESASAGESAPAAEDGSVTG